MTTRHLRRLPGLTVDDWRALCEALVLLVLVAGILRVSSFKRALAWIQRVGTTPIRSAAVVSDGAVPEAQRLARRLEFVADHLPLKPRCLVRALAGHALMLRRRIPSELVIGTERAVSTLRAHAWLGVDGRVVIGQVEADRYAPIWNHAS